MKVLLNIDEVAEQSIVPVKCGYETGTAFFIDSQHLLTAYHVVVDHIIDNATSIFIIVDGNTIVCTAKDLGEKIDIAILTCIDFVNDAKPFNLLASTCRTGQDLVIVGYPQEIGNCVDAFRVDVSASRGFNDTSRGFDAMVVRKDDVAFHSYSGFSGSPVINEFLSVVGVVTDQLHNTLGYTSIRIAKEKLIESGFPPFSNDDEEDTSSFGLGKCIFQIQNAQINAGSRYSRKLQIEDNDTEAKILDFAGVNNEVKLKNVHTSFNDWACSLRGKYREFVYSMPILANYINSSTLTDEVIQNIELLLYKEGDSESSYFFVNRDRIGIENVINLIEEYHNCLYVSEAQGLKVYGIAGCGKTFRLCNIAEKLARTTNTYLFFGTDFFDNEDPLDTIAYKLGWNTDRPFDELNDLMVRNERNAIFIIDGINEGTGIYFWQNKLPALMDRIKKWSNLKLIISLREHESNDVMQDVLISMPECIQINGFKDRTKAVKEFFKHYSISDQNKYYEIKEFDNPLFLKIFCQAYETLSFEDRRTVNRLAIYRSYLYQRNKEVSKGVDADPRTNFTSKFLYRLAEISLFQYRCGDIPREKVKRISYKLCPYRTWNNDLLNNALIENLLMEYTTRGNEELITFEYDSMGDYLKADRLLNYKYDDHNKLNTLLGLCRILYDSNDHKTNKSKIFNFIVSFLSLWNPNKEFWNKQEFINGSLTSALLKSISLRNIHEQSTLESSVIAKILQLNPNYLAPDLILNNFNVYNTQLLIDQVHTSLKNMTMAERDFEWSTKVNKLYDRAQYSILLSNATLLTDEDKLRFLMIECWMLTSSYPHVRNYLIRKIKHQLGENNEFILQLIDCFHDVNDPYIMQGLYSSIYGVLLNTRKADLALDISKRIISYHYPERGIAPNDYVLRHWTLKILEYGSHIARNSFYWNIAQPPYNVGENLFELFSGDVSDNFFGNTKGGNTLYSSLFHLDFYRYIIGGNSTAVTRDFVKEDGSGVFLEDITKTIAYLIKNKYSWNDNLGNYDAQVPYESRHNNRTERIGKKYQWIGLSEVYAYLLDVCKVKLDVHCDTERFAEVNYPWLAGNKIYFDPSLIALDEAANKVREIFDELPFDATMNVEAQKWVDDPVNMPSLQFIQTDKAGNEWIVLQGYDTKSEQEGEDHKRERFVYYNTCLVEQANEEIFSEWASEANFYGRWMPEANGSIEFLWNEYPWANSYKELNYGEEFEIDYGCPAKVRLPYNAQLQEDYCGIPESEENASTVYMPSEDMMTVLNLYTAERGIIREKGSDDIIAINRQIEGESFHGLLIQRDALELYLNTTHQSLFYNLLGEKTLRKKDYKIISFHTLTGAALYKIGGNIDEIQPLRFEPEERP